MTKVEKYVTKTLGAEVLVRSTNQPQTSYAVTSSLSEIKLKKILMDKMEENNSINRSDVQKNLYRALLEAYNSDKDLLSLYGEVVTLKSPPKSSAKSVQEEEHDPRVDDLEEPFHQEFDTGNDDVSPGKLMNLNMDEWFTLNVALRMYTRRIVIQERVEDLQLAVESYQKKINLTKPDTYRSDISIKTPYIAYLDIQGIIYQDDMNKNRLITDELHKFSDDTLNHVRTSLNDIATRIQMEYFPKRKWSKQDKQRARVMIKAIDKKLKDRRLIRSLEKFIGGRPYKGDLRLLQKRFYTSAGNPVKEILLKLNLPDHRKLKDGGEVKEFQRSFRHSDTERLSRSDEVLKLKNFKKDATLKLFKSTNQERYEHVGPKSQVSQDGKVH
ncbi:hypothetical protein Tco_1226227 [Tanacetum coccineum]